MQDPLEADSSSIRIPATHTLMLWTTRLFTVLEGILFSKWQYLADGSHGPSSCASADATDVMKAPASYPAFIQKFLRKLTSGGYYLMKCLGGAISELNLKLNTVCDPRFPSHCLCSCCFLCQNAFFFSLSLRIPSCSRSKGMSNFSMEQPRCPMYSLLLFSLPCHAGYSLSV